MKKEKIDEFCVFMNDFISKNNVSVSDTLILFHSCVMTLCFEIGLSPQDFSERLENFQEDYETYYHKKQK